MTAEEKPELRLTAAQIAEEITAAGVSLTSRNLAVLIAAAKETETLRAIDVFALKVLLPPHIPYETARRACASGALAAMKFAPDDDWYCTQDAIAQWIKANPKRWFESEGAVRAWRDALAALKPKWIA